MGEMRNAYNILAGKPKERGHSKDLGIDRKIILEWILNRVLRCYTGCIWLRIGTSGGLLVTR